MTWKRQESGIGNGKLFGIIAFTGVALFVMELDAGLDYVQARLANLLPGFMGVVPAVGIAAWKVVEVAFWNSAQLERTFRIVPFVTLPFLLVGLALCLRYKMVFQARNSVKSNER
jgi:hypothetical protein